MGTRSLTPAETWTQKLDSRDCQVVDGVKIARQIEADVAEQSARLQKLGKPPHLASLQIAHDPATDLYIRNQKKRFARLGIQFTHLDIDPRTDREGVLSHIRALNANPTVTGMMITNPLPEALDPHEVRQEILPEKDVEGLHAFNLGNLVYNRGTVGPCTALAVLKAIEATGIERQGCHAVIVGHSDTVGKPVTLCLLEELATTTTCHIATRDLKSETSRADLLIVAVGQPGLIRPDMVKPGAVVIDVGINEILAAGGQQSAGKKIVGDVDFEGVAEKAAWITPVPGGIGPITVAMLAQNTVLCTERQAESGE